MKKYISYSIVIIIFGLFNLFLHNDLFAGGAPCSCSCTDTYGGIDNAFCSAPAVVVNGACYNGDNTGISLCISGGCLDGNCSEQEFISFVATNDTILFNIDTTGGGSMPADPDVVLLTYGPDCPDTTNTTCPGGGGTGCIIQCNSGFGTFSWFGLTVGWTYYIIVESNDIQPCGGCGTCPSTAGSYTLCLAEPHCKNSVQDADETGIDCGGVLCFACHCFNSILDFDEDSVDCGGTECLACMSCIDNEDCGNAQVLTLTGTDTLSACVTDCNIGASPQGWTFSGGGCPNTSNTETVFYTFTTTNPYIDITINSIDIADPQIVLLSDDCSNWYACDEGSGGFASIVQFIAGSGNTYNIMVTTQSGATGVFDLCIFNYSINSACNLSDTLIAIPPPDTSGNFAGVYPPNTTVEFCYTLNLFSKVSPCQWLHGFVPIIGSGWDLSTFTITLNPASADGFGTWIWFPGDSIAITYNFNGSYYSTGDTVNPFGGWFYLNNCGICPAHGGDPNLSWGDGQCGGPCQCDPGGSGFSWSLCFTLTTPDSNCIEGADLSVGIKTFADGEIGGYVETGCDVDPITYPINPFPKLTCPACGIDSINTTNVLCFGESSGSAVVTMDTSGARPYTYSWNTIPVQTDSAATGLPAGTYTVIATDSTGCVDSSTVTITQPTLLVAGISDSTNISCPGQCDGIAIVTPAGGTSPYTYLWNNGQTDSTATGLCAGTPDTVIVTDANGCADTTFVTLSEPIALTSSITDNTNITCNGLCDGIAIVTPVGGTSPYIYLWNNGQTDSTATGLCAGTTDTVIVTDANGCVDTTFVTLSEPIALSSSITDSTNITCNGVCEGIAIATPQDGTAPYTYLWNNGQTDSTATGICAGTTDTVIVTDANGCADTTFVLLSQPAALTLPITDTNDANCGLSDGSATVTPSGGVSPYIYLWNDSLSQTDSIADSLSAGNYTVIVTDANGCIDSVSVNINNLGGGTADITDTTHVLCNGDSTGLATVTPVGGVSPYAFLWSPGGGVDSTATGLAAGTYTATVTDNAGCIALATVIITQPPALNLPVTAVPVLCNGDSTGSATVTPAGGIPPYTYLWNPAAGGQTDSTATGLPAGTFTVTITDNNGCVDSSSVTITQPASVLSAIITDLANVLCNGDSMGSATVTPSGGTPPYTYLWNPAAGGQTDSMATGLPAGTFTVIVIDANGCSDSALATLTQPPALTLPININDANCGLSDGSATVTPSGGVSPYTYLWNDSLSQTDSIADSLSAGNYTVIVTDANGCVDSVSVNINNIGGGTADITDTTHVACNGDSTGSATVTPVGGISPYAFLWDDIGAQTDSIATGLTAGTYTAAITDSAGCIALATVTITQPPALTLSITNTVQVTCNGDSTGSATATLSGGVLPYTYLWNDPSTQTDSTASGLPAGTFTVVITDANGCTETDSVIIAEPSALSLTTGKQDASCGANDGMAWVVVTGGTGPYSYLWSDSFTQITDTAFNLSFGTYTVTVMDSNGCIDSAATNVNEIGAPAITIDSVTNVSCNGGSDGAVYTTVSGGTLPYIYTWSSTDTTEDINNLTVGTYTITVIDSNGCNAMNSAAISEPPVMVLSLSSTDATCNNNDGTATVSIQSGGNPPYSFLWDDPPTFQTTATATGLQGGAYNVIVTDNTGCSVTETVPVNNIGNPVISLAITDESCPGESDGAVDLTVTGGTTPYAYLWSNSDTTEDINNLTTGTYIIIVTDNNNCVKEDTAIVNTDVANDCEEWYIYSGITPNGLNPVWVIKGLEPFKPVKVTLFNRWGDVVWESDDYNNDWAGTNMNGKPLPDGVYFYLVVKAGGEEEKGWVNIAR